MTLAVTSAATLQVIHGNRTPQHRSLVVPTHSTSSVYLRLTATNSKTKLSKQSHEKRLHMKRMHNQK